MEFCFVLYCFIFLFQFNMYSFLIVYVSLFMVMWSVHWGQRKRSNCLELGWQMIGISQLASSARMVHTVKGWAISPLSCSVLLIWRILSHWIEFFVYVFVRFLVFLTNEFLVFCDLKGASTFCLCVGFSSLHSLFDSFFDLLSPMMFWRWRDVIDWSSSLLKLLFFANAFLKNLYFWCNL